MTQPLISVVVPVYNAQKTLDCCIQSILSQTYQNLQLVLVNDGSKDDSLSLCRQYENKDSRIKVVDILNGGVSNARNTGMKASDGMFVTFVDSDDYVNIHYLETLYTHNLEDALVIAGYTLMTPKQTKDITFGNELLPISSFFEVYRAGLMGSPCNKIYDLNFIKEKNLFFDSSISLGEDLLFNLNYIQEKGYKKLKMVDVPILNYVHASEGTLSTSFTEKSVRTLAKLYHEMIEFMENYCHETSQIISMKERFYYDVLYYGEMIYLQSTNRQELYSFIKRFVKENEVTTLNRFNKESKNMKLKIKLWTIYYLDFGWFYKIFVRGDK